MYGAELFFKIKTDRKTLENSLVVWKEDFFKYCESDVADSLDDETGDEFVTDLFEMIEEDLYIDDNDQYDDEINFRLPLSYGVSVGEDLDVIGLFGNCFKVLAESSFNLYIEWDNPSDSHDIKVQMNEKNKIYIEYSDCDYESNSKTVKHEKIYSLIDGNWIETSQ